MVCIAWGQAIVRVWGCDKCSTHYHFLLLLWALITKYTSTRTNACTQCDIFRSYTHIDNISRKRHVLLRFHICAGEPVPRQRQGRGRTWCRGSSRKTGSKVIGDGKTKIQGTCLDLKPMNRSWLAQGKAQRKTTRESPLSRIQTWKYNIIMYLTCSLLQVVFYLGKVCPRSSLYKDLATQCMRYRNT